MRQSNEIARAYLQSTMMSVRNSIVHSQRRLHTIILYVVVLVSSFLRHVDAHSRWVCPPPRNPDTGIKTGPCGSETNIFTTTNNDISVVPGPLFVQWEESIHHTGAPFRIALSQDGSDDEPCILIDHIPHFDTVTVYPIFGNDTTYTLYSLTIDIPDIQCDACSLHLANPMTDKIGDDGAPTGIGCTDPLGTCFSVYHSCTIPITILGTTPRSQYTCPNTNPVDWPTSWIGDNGQDVDASTMGTYRREAATWEQSLLMDVGDNYRAFDTDTLLTCTKTEILPRQVNTPTTVSVPPPTNSPTALFVVPPTNAPTTILIPPPTNAPTTVLVPPPTSAPTTIMSSLPTSAPTTLLSPPPTSAPNTVLAPATKTPTTAPTDTPTTPNTISPSVEQKTITRTMTPVTTSAATSVQHLLLIPMFVAIFANNFA